MISAKDVKNEIERRRLVAENAKLRRQLEDLRQEHADLIATVSAGIYARRDAALSDRIIVERFIGGEGE